MRYRKYVTETTYGWSQWLPWYRLMHLSCCDCGLVHTHQTRVKVNRRTGEVKLWVRVRRNKKRTHDRRCKPQKFVKAKR